VPDRRGGDEELAHAAHALTKRRGSLFVGSVRVSPPARGRRGAKVIDTALRSPRLPPAERDHRTMVFESSVSARYESTDGASTVFSSIAPSASLLIYGPSR
jgi:hypothetical protein